MTLNQDNDMSTYQIRATNDGGAQTSYDTQAAAQARCYALNALDPDRGYYVEGQ